MKFRALLLLCARPATAPSANALKFVRLKACFARLPLDDHGLSGKCADIIIELSEFEEGVNP